MVSIYVTTSIFFKENPKMDPPRKFGLISLLPVPGQYERQMFFAFSLRGEVGDTPFKLAWRPPILIDLIYRPAWHCGLGEVRVHVCSCASEEGS